MTLSFGFWILDFRFQIQSLLLSKTLHERVTLLRTLVPRYRFANATAALTAVAPGGNPLGASLSQCEKTALPHQNLKSKI
ncbi:hypothetical protein [uncultured Nostoc sp.]|uniref:hypothetical protein n=1 Tax=uncultured Nostoc sp. TaxID=340711 RepID=UPI0035CA4F9D